MLFNREQKETGNEVSVRTIVPRVDIQEYPELYLLRLDMPGAEKDKIKVQMTNRVLSVTATAPAYFKQDATLLLDDSVAAEYERDFTLADNIEIGNVEASYDLGVLTLNVRKKEQYMPKEIKVN
jgi:HSP20 family protein